MSEKNRRRALQAGPSDAGLNGAPADMVEASPAGNSHQPEHGHEFLLGFAYRGERFGYPVHDLTVADWPPSKITIWPLTPAGNAANWIPIFSSAGTARFGRISPNRRGSFCRLRGNMPGLHSSRWFGRF
jgi:hypothetical protein